MADIATWPASIGLDCALRSSFGYKPAGSNIIQSQNDGGAPRRRRRYTSSLEDCTGIVVVSEAKVQVLFDFYDFTLGEVLPFVWVDFRKPFGPTNTAIYRFTDRPEASPDAGLGLWRISLSLQLLSSNAGRFLLDVSDANTGLTNT